MVNDVAAPDEHLNGGTSAGNSFGMDYDSRTASDGLTMDDSLANDPASQIPPVITAEWQRVPEDVRIANGFPAQQQPQPPPLQLRDEKATREELMEEVMTTTAEELVEMGIARGFLKPDGTKFVGPKPGK